MLLLLQKITLLQFLFVLILLQRTYVRSYVFLNKLFDLLPLPAILGHSVRNIQAFSVLQNAFLKAKTSYLAQIILDAITNIYMADSANYFILESQHTLSQFAEKISKIPEVQTKYFEMLEFVIFSLNYIPCKELISVSILLKSSTLYQCSIVAMKTLLKFTRHDYIFKDVFREVGLLEVMVNILHKYAALLKDPTQALNDQGRVTFLFLLIYLTSWERRLVFVSGNIGLDT